MAHLLDPTTAPRPVGYRGAPLLATLIGELLRRGYKVSAFTISSDIPEGQTFVARGRNLTLTVCSMRPRAWGFNGRQVGRIVDLYRAERKALTRTISNAAPDVIHAHWAYEFALAAIDSGLPHVVTCHDSPYRIARMFTASKPTISLYRWLRVLMAQRALRSANVVSVVSPYMRDEVQKITRALVDVVPNPIDDLTNELSRVRQQPVSAKLVMICNGWDSRKNAKPSLRAFAQIRKQNAEAELHLYGSGFGSDEPGAQWCRRAGITSGMFFHGRIPHDALLRKLPDYDLLIHPSIEESFGLVLAEAMAIGVPVVAGARSGAVPWVVGDCGRLCDVADSRAIGAAVTELLKPENYASASAGGIVSARARFSTSCVVDQFIDLYERALRTAPVLQAPRVEKSVYGNR